MAGQSQSARELRYSGHASAGARLIGHKVYWMRRDLKWRGYEPSPEVKTVDAFLDIVDRDEYYFFFG
jgi:hypothetical protein